ncbi:MAG: saccharopine dehydrogenase C-terminal domain-containing protein [Bacillota bacterium]|nr:saccharopine dehydrogenase C-terminal domain-containing protein [Bacillota bacterium]
MGKTILLLGHGMQGKCTLWDLMRGDLVDHVIVADRELDLDGLYARYPRDRVEGAVLDATDTRGLSGLMRQADLVIELLPGRFAYPVARLAVDNGVHLVNSMYLANAGEQDEQRIEERKREVRRLDADAKAQGLTVLTEFGLDPGVDLVLSMLAIRELDSVSEFYSYGAGIPEPAAADNALKYKFTWSVEGVLRSYLRPAWTIEDGQVREISAADVFAPEHMHLMDLPEIGGVVECFPNGNAVKYAEMFGIRDAVRRMGRYTCRWPGHGAFWYGMAQSGFLSEEPVKVGGGDIAPLDFAMALMGSQPQFWYKHDERDIAIVRVDARGYRAGQRTRVVYQLVDRRDLTTGFTAMTRTVGFPVSAGAQMILRGDIDKRGVVTPVEVPADILLKELTTRGLVIEHRVMPWKG